MKYCQSCGEKVGDTAKFCRHCGKSINGISLLSDGLVRFKLSRKLLVRSGLFITAVILVAGASATAYTWYQVRSIIDKSYSLQQEGKFDESNSALLKLDTIKLRLNYGEASRKNIASENAQHVEHLKVLEAIQPPLDSLTLEVLLSHQDALLKIPDDFPLRSLLNDKRAEVSAAIKNVASKQVESSSKSTRSAQNRAASAEQARAAADARAQQAQQAAMNSSANAEAARAAEVQNSFVTQLSNLFDDYISGCLAYVTEAAEDISRDNYTAARSSLAAADAACTATRSSAARLHDSFTGLPNSYYQAASDIYNSTSYIEESIIAFINEDYDSALSYQSISEGYLDRVVRFFNSL